MVSSIIENKPDNPKIVPPIWDYPAYFLELDTSGTPSFSSNFFISSLVKISELLYLGYKSSLNQLLANMD